MTQISVSTIIGVNAVRVSAVDTSIDVNSEDSAEHLLSMIRQQTLNSLLESKAIDQKVFDNLSQVKF